MCEYTAISRDSSSLSCFALYSYYIWIYWMNYFAWALRGLAVNEFDSGKYDDLEEGGNTEGENILIRFGFTLNGEAFTFEWAWYAVAFMIGWAAICSLLSVLILKRIRFTTGGSLATDKGDDFVEEIDAADMVSIPFTKVDMTFKDIHYTVTASTSDDRLELLKGIDGIVASGKMTALMGSSGVERPRTFCSFARSALSLTLSFVFL